MSSIVDDCKDEIGLWRRSVQVDKEQLPTRSGSTWWGMSARCTVGGSFQKSRPSYVGCSMTSNFKDFQFFVDWSRSQAGYNTSNFALDKDLLVFGNKIYSEDTCVFIPQALNQFLVNRAASRGEYPVGVNFDKARGRLRAMCSVHNGIRKNLGYFDTVFEAAGAYKIAKEAEAKRWYERLKAGEFIVDERVIERMRTWTLEVE